MTQGQHFLTDFQGGVYSFMVSYPFILALGLLSPYHLSSFHHNALLSLLLREVERLCLWKKQILTHVTWLSNWIIQRN